MKMSSLERIRNSFEKNVFSMSDLKRIGVSRYLLGKLLQEGSVYKVAHGIYALSEGDTLSDASFQLATLRIGEPAVICLLSALEYYDLTDIIAKEVWMMVPAHKRTRQRDIKLLRVSELKLDIGIVKKMGFRITSVDRTIVDALTHHRQLPVSIGIEALRRALQLKKTTLSKIADMAKVLNVFHRIQAYVEALV